VPLKLSDIEEQLHLHRKSMKVTGSYEYSPVSFPKLSITHIENV